MIEDFKTVYRVVLIPPQTIIPCYPRSPQFKYMIFHVFTCIPHHLRVHYELTM